jgi:hypothetical protein
MTAKEILLDELNEQNHPEKVEDVIFWALEHYSNSEPKGTWGRTIAYAIKERILEVEKSKSALAENPQLNIDTLTVSPYNYSEKDVITNTKVPIKRGCAHTKCACTGECNEIIGWRDKLPNEF